MKFLKLIPILFILSGNFPYKNLVHAEIKNPKDYKVLSNQSKKLSISKSMLNKYKRSEFNEKNKKNS